MSKTPSRQAVIFDMDGVLVDTAEFHKQSWYDLAAKDDLTMSDEFFFRTFGMQNYQIIPQMTDRPLTREQVDAGGELEGAAFPRTDRGQTDVVGGRQRTYRRTWPRASFLWPSVVRGLA